MNILEKLGFSKKPKTSLEIEQDLESQIKNLEADIKREEAVLASQPDNVRSLGLERMKKDLKGLQAKKNLAWEKARLEGERVSELTK